MKLLCVLALLVSALTGCATAAGGRAVSTAAEAMVLRNMISFGDDAASFLIEPAREGIEQTDREVVVLGDSRRVVRLEGLSEEVWERDESGWRLMSEVDVKDEVQLVYTPGMLLLPDRVDAEGAVSSGDVVVRRMSDGSLRASGTYQTRLTAERLNEGVTVIERRSMGLQLAGVEVEVWSDYDGRGVLMERETRVTTRVLGLMPDVELRGLKRVD